MEIKILKAYKSQYIEGIGKGYILSVVEGNEIILKCEVYVFMDNGIRIDKENMQFPDIELLGLKGLQEEEGNILDYSKEYGKRLLSGIIQKEREIRIGAKDYGLMELELQEIPRFEAVRDLHKRDKSLCDWVTNRTRCRELWEFCAMVVSMNGRLTDRDNKTGLWYKGDKKED